MNFLQTMANMLISDREFKQTHTSASIHDVNRNYDALNQFELGTQNSPDNKPRTRQQIYLLWEIMQKDPQVAEALSLHVTAALGGHETTGDMIFLTPHDRVRGKGRRAKELRARVEREARYIAPIINRNAFAMALQAVGYGDSYSRIYTDEKAGVIDLMNNRHTAPPLIMPFEQAGRTIGFHALEEENLERSIAKLTPMQILRVKMPRIKHVPQVPLQVWQDSKVLTHDLRSDSPLLPSEVGGSFLYQIEDPWKDVTISRAGLNNQQIADSVRQTFLTLNMESMPADQQRKYTAGLTKMLTKYRDQIEEAFKGGEALYGTKHHVLPQWGEKQILQSVGDLSQRNAPLNEGLLMLNLRRLAGGLGIDLSLMGWADMLAGGLGDGAAFHTSAQIMRRSTFIRQANIDAYNHLMSIHWGIKYGEFFEPQDYPWQFDFYSDANAAATQALNNKQSRANTTTIQMSAVQIIKELGLGKETSQLILEDEMGYDIDMAEKIAISISQPVIPEGMGMPNGMGGQPMTEADYEPQEMEFDDEV